MGSVLIKRDQNSKLNHKLYFSRDKFDDSNSSDNKDDDDHNDHNNDFSCINNDQMKE